jgi:hypothetical protein
LLDAVPADVEQAAQQITAQLLARQATPEDKPEASTTGDVQSVDVDRWN